MVVLSVAETILLPVSCGSYLCPGCQAESIPVAQYHRQTVFTAGKQRCLLDRPNSLRAHKWQQDTTGLTDITDVLQLEAHFFLSLAIASINYDNSAN